MKKRIKQMVSTEDEMLFLVEKEDGSQELLHRQRGLAWNVSDPILRSESDPENGRRLSEYLAGTKE